MPRRQAMRVHEETIDEDLIANIPVVGAGTEDETVFVPVANEEEVIIMPPSSQEIRTPASEAAQGGVAEQLRYEMGEAFARELDRAAQMVSAAMADLEIQVARLHEQVAALHTENEELRAARENAERKLNAFKELALGR